MKKMFTLTIVSVILNMALGGIVWWKFFKSDRLNKQELVSASNVPTAGKQSKKVEKVFNIAMLTPEMGDPILEIQEGFETTFRTLGDGAVDTKIKVYDSRGDRTLLRSQVEAIAQTNYDLIFTIGTPCTQMMKEIACKRDKKTPIVFCAIQDPVGKGIIKNEQAPGVNITGVTAQRDWKMQVDILTLVKKNLKRALIVYDPAGFGGYIEQWRKSVEDAFNAKGIETKAIHIFSINEVIQKVSPFIETADVVITLRDATTYNSMPAIARLCDRYHVTLYGSHTDSLDRGASITFAVEEREGGVLAAEHAYNILVKGMNPAQMPVTSLSTNYKLWINRKSMKQQSLEIDPQIEFLMQHARVIEDTAIEAQ